MPKQNNRTVTINRNGAQVTFANATQMRAGLLEIIREKQAKGLTYDEAHRAAQVEYPELFTSR